MIAYGGFSSLMEPTVVHLLWVVGDWEIQTYYRGVNECCQLRKTPHLRGHNVECICSMVVVIMGWSVEVISYNYHQVTSNMKQDMLFDLHICQELSSLTKRLRNRA